MAAAAQHKMAAILAIMMMTLCIQKSLGQSASSVLEASFSSHAEYSTIDTFNHSSSYDMFNGSSSYDMFNGSSSYDMFNESSSYDMFNDSASYDHVVVTPTSETVFATPTVPSGAPSTPSGASSTPSGASSTPSGASSVPSGASSVPSGASATPVNPSAVVASTLDASSASVHPTGVSPSALEGAASTTPPGGDQSPSSLAPTPHQSENPISEPPNTLQPSEGSISPTDTSQASQSLDQLSSDANTSVSFESSSARNDTIQPSSTQKQQESSSTTVTQQPTVAQTTTPPITVKPTTQPTTLDVTGELFPYGDTAADRSFNNDYPRRSDKIVFRTNVPFGTSSFKQAHVLSSGVIIFGTDRYAYYPNLNYYLGRKNLLAPFWAYMSYYEDFNIYYHLYEKADGTTPTVTQAVLARAANEVNTNYPGLSGFTPTTALVATWENVKPYNWYSWICKYYSQYSYYRNSAYYTSRYNSYCNNNQEETNTFQAVYVTDGVTAYALFKYKSGAMKWTFDKHRRIDVGFVNDDGATSLDITYSSLTTTLDTDTGNYGQPGAYLYKVGKIVNPAAACREYHSKNIAAVTGNSTYNGYVSTLYDCACTRARLGRQWWYMDSVQISSDPLTYIECHALSPVAKRRLERINGNPLNKKCCYLMVYPSTNWWVNWMNAWRNAPFINNGPYAGRILNNDPWYWKSTARAYHTDDLIPHRRCCVESDNCHLFDELRAPVTCNVNATFITGRALGDPHITTFDDKTYTMNGWGEYNLAIVTDESFTLQGRTDRAIVSSKVTNATVFVAFAAKELTGTFQVVLNSSKTGMDILGKGIDVTDAFYTTDSYSRSFDDDVSVTKDVSGERITVEASFPSGISVRVHIGQENLEFSVTMPVGLKGKVKGMMGNYNDDLSDEFILPDGTQLSTNLTERQIFSSFASQWQVRSSDTIFTYPPGKGALDFRHDDFVPFYKDEADSTQLAAAVVACNNDPTADACIFDYLATGDASFASATFSVNQQGQSERTDLTNSLPTLAVTTSLLTNGRWSLTHSTAATIQLIGTDADGDALTYMDVTNSTGQTLSIDTNGLVSFTPDYQNPAVLSFQVNDTKGGVSSILVIPVTVCSSCQSHGSCESDTRLPSQFTDTNFMLFACNCLAAWTGADCETDIDYCPSKPCLDKQDCTEIAASVQQNQEIGYECGPCPTGYVNNTQDGRCADVNECDSGACHSAATCENTQGSFSCQCNNGYRLDAANDTNCLDIDECVERSSGCQQDCTNTEGSFTCTCNSAYTLNGDGKTCTISNSAKDLCTTAGCLQVCSVNQTVATCSCYAGYKNVTGTCTNIDECSEGVSPCTQKCIDSEGSYTCSCYPGFKLASDGLTCEACVSPMYGTNCASKCLCNGQGQCDAIRGCVCNAGWTGTNCTTDINECTTDPSACPIGENCTNTLGSKECSCPTGFTRQGVTCKDIDECSDITTHTCDLSVQDCENSVGSYGCKCKTGFALGPSSSCEDIDECTKGTHECQSICENVVGLYNCKCPFGYSLMADRKNCEEVENACQEYLKNNVTCAHTCSIDRTAKTATCQCNQGYYLATDEFSCSDINECDEDHLNLCADKTTCVNSDGSYSCSCHVGAVLDNDGRTCIPCTGGKWGDKCSNDCNCGPNGQCDVKLGCKCNSGYTGTNCDKDIDECAAGIQVCTSPQECNNLVGSAECGCSDGYVKTGSSCFDIDECTTGTHDCSQVCTNTPGNFTCSCRSGYRLVGKECNDIDECTLRLDECVQTCINIDGKYRCDCNRGYTLNQDGVSCSAAEVCGSPNSCSEMCARIDGQDVCSCPLGKTLNTTDNSTCDDVDLCVGNHCSDDCEESSDNTTVVCGCPLGKKLNEDGFTCSECVEGKYGAGCVSSCTCKGPTTESCNKTTGVCNCKSGYESSDCGSNIDECTRKTDDCFGGSVCKDTPGSFICQCPPGTYSDGSSCKTCLAGYFGQECLELCLCDKAHSSCNATDGSCDCNSGYGNTLCDTDINECLGVNTCTAVAVSRPNWECFNLPGTYECKCGTGYKLNGTVCDDVDECAAAFSNQCAHNCTNTPGNYTCSCRSGYYLNPVDGRGCLDTNECNTNNGGCGGICTNTDGTFECSCASGSHLSSNGRTCTKSQSYRGKWTFPYDTTGIIFDEDADSYKNITAAVKAAMLAFMQSRNSKVLDLIIHKITKGSLVVDASAVLDTTSADQTGSLINTLISLSQANLTINGQSTQPTIVVNGTTLGASTDRCALREDVSPCTGGTTCVVVNGEPICSGGDDDDDDIPLIVGLSVGIPLLVIIIVLIVVLVYFKTKNKELVRVASQEGHYAENISRPASGKSNDGLLMQPGQ